MNKENKIVIDVIEVDLNRIQNTVTNALSLEGNEQLFEELASIERTKKELKDALERIESAEATVKFVIDNKATELYSNNWAAIKGQNYKITKSPVGSLYNFVEGQKPAEEFVKIKESIDTKAVNTYIKDKGALPEGITYNTSRGSSIRITVY